MLFPMLRRPSLLGNGQRSILADFERLQRDLDNLFSTSVAVSPNGTPAIEFLKSEDGYLVRANVPGLTPAELEITVLGKKLTIKGERMAETHDEVRQYTMRERRAEQFSRTITLPHNIDAERVSANFADGVVEISLPLAANEQPRRIEIGHS